MGVQEWLNRNIGSLFGDATNKAADFIQDATKDNIKLSSGDVKKAMPFVAAGTVALAGLAFMPTVQGLGTAITKGVRNVVTGFGYFEKIPLIGGLFRGAGWLVDKISSVSGLLLTGAVGLLAYYVFQSKPSMPSGNPANMPDSGTGAVPQEPLTDTFRVYRPGTNVVQGQRDGPTQPRPVAPSPGAAQLLAGNPALADTSYATLRAARARTLTEATRDPVLAEQLRALMQDENQRYENRRLFLRRVTEFTDTKPQSSRDVLVGLLGDNGLTPAEAAALVPVKPNLRYTVTSGQSATDNSTGTDGQLTDFGGRFASLLQVAQQMEGFYGVGYFQVAKRNDNGSSEKVGIAVKDMSVTQLQEYIQAALEHARTKYRFYSPKVHNRSAVTSVDRAGGGSVTYWTEYDFGNGSETYRDAQGGARVRTWREEYDFLSSFNGDSTRSMNWSPPNHGHGIHMSGSHQVRGEGSGSALAMFAQWQVMLDQHREELKLAETSYNGEIRRYIDRVRFMQQSLKMVPAASVALLDYSDSHIQIRDLRQFRPGAAPDNAQLLRLDGEWVDAAHTSFAVRAFTGADGNKVFLRSPATINLDTAQGVRELMTTMDEARRPAATRTPTPSVGVTNLDRTGGTATVVDSRTTGEPLTRTFAGRFDGNRFIATGLVVPGQLKPLPPLPEDQKLRLRNIRDYNAEGEESLSSFYSGGGFLYRDVRLKGPDGSVKIYVLRFEEGNGGWGLKDVAIKEPGYDRKDIPWYSSDYESHAMPETRVTMSRMLKNGMEDHNYYTIAKVAATLMDNPPIERENEARERRFQAAIRPSERLVTTPLPRPEIIVGDVNRPEDWTPVLDGARFNIGTITPKTSAHADDPFKTSTHMVHLTDANLKYEGRVIVHGKYDERTKIFTVDGYELRDRYLADNRPGQYVTLATTLNFETRDFKDFFAKVSDESYRRAFGALPQPAAPATSASAGKTTVTDKYEPNGWGYIYIRDERKTGLPQNITLQFQRQDNGTYKLMKWQNFVAKDEQHFYHGNSQWRVPAQEVVLTAQQYKDLSEGKSSPDAIIDAQDTFAKNNFAVRVLREDNGKNFIRVTDRRGGTPVEYDLVGTVNDGRFVIESAVFNGSIILRTGTVGDIHDPKAWLRLIDTAKEAARAPVAVSLLPANRGTFAATPVTVEDGTAVSPAILGLAQNAPIAKA